VLGHFIKYSNANIGNKQLLVMDSHDSHLSVEGLELAKASGVIILALPPNTSNKTQPLDRTVFGPFKTYYGNSCNSWMMSNAGKPLSIYQVAELAGNAWERAANPTNIKAGFRVSGIWPYDRDVFSDASFLPSTVTDRADPNAARPQLEQPDVDVVVQDRGHQPEQNADEQLEDSNLIPATSGAQLESPRHVPSRVNISSSAKSNPVLISPQELYPFPKAPPRKDSQKGRKCGKSIISTSTPELKRLKEEKQKKEAAAAAKKREDRC
jgi:hypothetical protein